MYIKLVVAVKIPVLDLGFVVVQGSVHSNKPNFPQRSYMRQWGRYCSPSTTQRHRTHEFTHLPPDWIVPFCGDIDKDLCLYKPIDKGPIKISVVAEDTPIISYRMHARVKVMWK